jgi:alpha-beta hydrolase superfamily lysophospholipase
MRRTPNVEAAFIRGAAHFIADERPEAVVDHALKFFAEPARQADLR